MDDHEAASPWRALVFGGDCALLVAELRSQPWPADSLQLIGGGILEAVHLGAPGAVELARRCAHELRQRVWTGDHELADALDAASGDGPAPALRPLPVDLEELSSILEGDPLLVGGIIDLVTGEVWPQAVLDDAVEPDAEEDYDDPDKWLWVDGLGSRDGYEDMLDFIDAVEDTYLADALSRSISGRGAFRRFKDRLAEHPDLLARWYAYSDDRHRGRARRWLADAGYTPTRSTTEPGY